MGKKRSQICYRLRFYLIHVNYKNLLANFVHIGLNNCQLFIANY